MGGLDLHLRELQHLEEKINKKSRRDYQVEERWEAREAERKPGESWVMEAREKECLRWRCA